MLDLVRAGLPAALAAGRRALSAPPVPLAAVRLLPPLAAPTVRDFVAFEEHVEGVAASVGDGTGVVPEWYQAPTFYFTNPYALIGAHDDVPVPPGCSAPGLRARGRRGRRAGRRVADRRSRRADHVFGYTVLNDWSARDLQRREMKVSLGPAKGKDSATTLGPWLVTADELEPYRDADGFLALDLRASVNGMRGRPGPAVQHGLAVRGAHRLRLARHPGPGRGRARLGHLRQRRLPGRAVGPQRGADPPPLRPGDVVELTVEGIGTVRNRVVPGLDLPPVPAARPRPRIRKRTS